MSKPQSHGGLDPTGHYRCYFCDGIVCHEGSDMAIDIYDESDPEDVLHYMRCSHYGAEYEIIQRAHPEGGTPMQDELRLRKQYLSDHD